MRFGKLVLLLRLTLANSELLGQASQSSFGISRDVQETVNKTSL
jgi:hypothetical protein